MIKLAEKMRAPLVHQGMKVAVKKLTEERQLDRLIARAGTFL